MGHIWFQHPSIAMQIVRLDSFCCPMVDDFIKGLNRVFVAFFFLRLRAVTNYILDVSHSSTFLIWFGSKSQMSPCSKKTMPRVPCDHKGADSMRDLYFGGVILGMTGGLCRTQSVASGQVFCSAIFGAEDIKRNNLLF